MTESCNHILEIIAITNTNDQEIITYQCSICGEKTTNQRTTSGESS